MSEILGATLSSAAAIAISPIPIIAVILMLMTPRAARLGLVFLVGWFSGIIIATGVFTAVSGAIPGSPVGAPQPVLGTVLLVLGLGLVLLAVRQWRTRPAPGATPELPAWMSKIDTMSAGAALGLAFALAAINPKNLLVAATAGALIGHSGLDVPAQVVAVVVFALIAALSVLVPVVAALLAPRAAARALTGIRTWLTANNAVIMTVLLLILGLNVIGNGIGMY